MVLTSWASLFGTIAAMKFIDGPTVHRLADLGLLMDALEAAHRLPPPRIGRSLLQPRAGEGRAGEAFLVLPAWAPGRAMGVKMATLLPGNADFPAGPPTVQAVYQLFEGATGSPVATLDGTMLTLVKTAADSGLGARLLTRDDAEILLMIGAGALAPHLIHAHMTARPSLRRVLIWNRTPARRNTLLAELVADGVPAEAATDLAQATGTADVICAATMAIQPLIHGAALKAGTHVDLVGGFTPEMRESDDETMRRARIFVNHRGSTVGEVGDLTQPMATGVIGPDAVLGDLFDLCSGRHPGRTSKDEITLYKNGGGGHLDLFTAEFLVARAAAEHTA